MKLLHDKKGVIFDLDGVIIDTAKFHKQSWYDLAEEQGFEMTDDFFYKTFGMQNYQIIPMLSQKEMASEEISRLSEWKEKRYRELIAGKLQLLGGVKDLIDDLKSQGFMLAIGTSTPRVNVDFLFEQLPLEGCFDAVVTGEEVTNGKPAPDTFLKAAQKLSLEPEDCTVIEDAVAGVKAAMAAGMKAVAVTNTTERENLTEADLIVDSLRELNAEDFIELIGHNTH